LFTLCIKKLDGSGCELLDDRFAAHFEGITLVVDTPVTDLETVQAIVRRPFFGTDRIKSHDNASRTTEGHFEM
jgi:hypothetical protein